MLRTNVHDKTLPVPKASHVSKYFDGCIITDG